MRVLFAITALCLLVLLWAGLAIRRHIRAAARERAERNAPPAREVFEAELRKELQTQRANTGFYRGQPDNLSDPRPGRHASGLRPSVRDSAVRAAIVAAAKESIVSYEPAAGSAPVSASAPAAEPQTEPAAEETSESRKQPVSISGITMERLDRAHFNKDLGDLSDPYQIPRSAIRNRS